MALRLGVEVEAIDDGRRVRLVGGSEVEGDIVLVAGGVEPNAAIARDAGLAVQGGRIVVDAQMRNSRPGVRCRALG